MKEDDIIDECLKVVAMVHKKPLGEIRSYFIRGVIKKWPTDPYTLGAFVYSFPHHVRLNTTNLKTLV